MKRLVGLEQLLRSRGIRLTAQRRRIARRAIAHLHFTAEALVNDVRRSDPSVARGTVYRTLSLMHRWGVVEKHDFRYGPPNYEATFGKTHHDHLMCIQCGEIIEFQEPKVEALQQALVKRYGYQLLSHTHKLYGLCRKCQSVNPKRASKHPRLHVEEVVA
jgi:Fur family ferric uptake transcriptional regulator